MTKWEQIANAIALETMFCAWCGDNYDLFHSGGTFPGIGTPREIFRERLPGLFDKALTN